MQACRAALVLSQQQAIPLFTCPTFQDTQSVPRSWFNAAYP